MPRRARQQRVVDELERIGSTRVLGRRVVVEIELTRDRVAGDVFEQRAEAPRSRVDLRLGFGRQANRLRVAATFEVEYPVVAPTVLVIANQTPVRVARERGFPGA